MTSKQKVALGAGIGGVAGAGAGLGLVLGFEPASISSFLSEAASNEIAKAGFFFVVAAWIHSNRVRNEIAKNFQSLTDAINNAANALRNDLEAQSRILANHSVRLDNLEKQTNIQNQGEANA